MRPSVRCPSPWTPYRPGPKVTLVVGDGVVVFAQASAGGEGHRYGDLPVRYRIDPDAGPGGVAVLGGPVGIAPEGDLHAVRVVVIGMMLTVAQSRPASVA